MSRRQSKTLNLLYRALAEFKEAEIIRSSLRHRYEVNKFSGHVEGNAPANYLGKIRSKLIENGFVENQEYFEKVITEKKVIVHLSIERNMKDEQFLSFNILQY